MPRTARRGTTRTSGRADGGTIGFHFPRQEDESAAAARCVIRFDFAAASVGANLKFRCIPKDEVEYYWTVLQKL